MAFDEGLAQRLREQLADDPSLAEKRMFGGLSFMLNGNMAVGVLDDYLIVRIDKDEHDDALAEPNVREFDSTGRPSRGWIVVEADGLEADDELARWVERGKAYAGSLPPK